MKHETEKPELKAQNFKTSGLVLKIFLITVLVGGVWFFGRNSNGNNVNDLTVLTAEPVSAQKIYPLFECSCCGKSIDQCTCGMAQERRAFIDGLAAGGLTEEKVVMAYVKKYGLNSFMDKDKGKEFRQKLAMEAPIDRPIISLSPEVYDFGDVSQRKGTSVTFFDIENQGKSDLIITRLETSCGCTSAAVVYQGKEGPRFNMPGHDVNEKVPDDWQVVIPAGQKAELKVYYDPYTHKDFRGGAIREIYVFSNDPIDFEKKVSIELNQVD